MITQTKNFFFSLRLKPHIGWCRQDLTPKDMESKWISFSTSINIILRYAILQDNKEIGEKYGIHPRDVESKELAFYR